MTNEELVAFLRRERGHAVRHMKETDGEVESFYTGMASALSLVIDFMKKQEKELKKS